MTEVYYYEQKWIVFITNILIIVVENSHALYVYNVMQLILP